MERKYDYPKTYTAMTDLVATKKYKTLADLPLASLNKLVASFFKEAVKVDKDLVISWLYHDEFELFLLSIAESFTDETTIYTKHSNGAYKIYQLSKLILDELYDEALEASRAEFLDLLPYPKNLFQNYRNEVLESLTRDIL